MSKNVLMVIACCGFRDEEYLEPKALLEEAGFKVSTAASRTGTATGKLGATATVDLSLAEAKAGDHDALLFIGGPGSYDYFKDRTALQLARDAAAAGKIVGGICAAAAILAHAGLLQGKKATGFSGVADILKAGGADYTAQGVERDGQIITATGPQTAAAFGRAVIQALNGK